VVRKVDSVIDMYRHFGVLDRTCKRDTQMLRVRAAPPHDSLGVEAHGSGGCDDGELAHPPGIVARYQNFGTGILLQ
jgi:hypothetical protein